MVIDHAAISAAPRASLNIDELSSFVVSVCIVKRWGSDGVISPEASGLLSPMGSLLRWNARMSLYSIDLMCDDSN